MQVLIWGLKCLLSMLRCMLGSVKGVKSENPKGEGKLGNEKRGCYSKGVPENTNLLQDLINSRRNFTSKI